MAAARREAQTCDVTLVEGSSLEVNPAADLPVQAKRHGASLGFVNLSPTELDPLADIVIHADVIDVLPQIASALEHESDAYERDHQPAP